MKNTKEKGTETESLVCKYIEKYGYKVLCRNFRVAGGEIDIIALNGNEISFIEVKRMLSCWEEADISRKVDYKKQNKIRYAASVYLAQSQNLKYDKISFDVVAVTGSDIRYYGGAF